MRTKLTALSTDRQVLGVWLDDKEVVAWFAEMAELKAIEDEILNPAIWLDMQEELALGSTPGEFLDFGGRRYGKSLIQSVLAEKLWEERQRDKIRNFGMLYGMPSRELLTKYAPSDAELTKKLLDAALDKMKGFNKVVARGVKVVHHVHDEMLIEFDAVEKWTEVLNVWKKTEPAGGTPPVEGSREGGA